jgi:hypothetical protein
VIGGLKAIESGRRGRIMMLDISFLLYGNSVSLPVVRHAKYDPTVAAPTQKYDAVR